MKILGIDPGTAITGWGVIKQSAKSVNDLSVVDYGVIRTKKTKQHLNRLQEIYEDMKQVLNRFLPDIVAVEKLYFCKNVKTAITVGEARGMVLLAIAQMGLEFYEYTPLQIKDAVCGYGKADKKQVQNMVSSILSLDSVPKPDDAADALAVAICCSSAYKMQQNLKSNVVDK